MYLHIYQGSSSSSPPQSPPSSSSPRSKDICFSERETDCGGGSDYSTPAAAFFPLPLCVVAETTRSDIESDGSSSDDSSKDQIIPDCHNSNNNECGDSSSSSGGGEDDTCASSSSPASSSASMSMRNNSKNSKKGKAVPSSPSSSPANTKKLVNASAKKIASFIRQFIVPIGNSVFTRSASSSDGSDGIDVKTNNGNDNDDDDASSPSSGAMLPISTNFFVSQEDTIRLIFERTLDECPSALQNKQVFMMVANCMFDEYHSRWILMQQKRLEGELVDDFHVGCGAMTTISPCASTSSMSQQHQGYILPSPPASSSSLAGLMVRGGNSSSGDGSFHSNISRKALQEPPIVFDDDMM